MYLVMRRMLKAPTQPQFTFYNIPAANNDVDKIGPLPIFNIFHSSLNAAFKIFRSLFRSTDTKQSLKLARLTENTFKKIKNKQKNKKEGCWEHHNTQPNTYILLCYFTVAFSTSPLQLSRAHWISPCIKYCFSRREGIFYFTERTAKNSKNMD